MSRVPLGLHGFHGAFLDAVIGIIETAGVLDQTKIAVFAVAEAAATNIDESGLIEGGGKGTFVSHPQMGGAADQAARQLHQDPFRSKPRGAHEP
jgi:hypothetical protein